MEYRLFGEHADLRAVIPGRVTVADRRAQGSPPQVPMQPIQRRDKVEERASANLECLHPARDSEHGYGAGAKQSIPVRPIVHSPSV